MSAMYAIARQIMRGVAVAAGGTPWHCLLMASFAMCLAAEADGQVRRLPPVDRNPIEDRVASSIALPPGQILVSDRRHTASLPASTVSYPHSLSESNLPAAQLAPPRSGGLSPSKDGFLQRVSLSASILGSRDAGDLQQTEVELYATVGLPMPTRESPLLISPGYEIRFLNGPAVADLPSTLHDAYLELRWMRKLSQRWGLDIAVSPGAHSDFENWNDDAIRITGHGVAQWSYSDTLKTVLGIAYLDRDDVSLLPAAGLIWTPTESIRCDLLFPRPKIGWRMAWSGDSEDWLYLAGEFGGGSWSVERTGGVTDTLTLRDYRVVLGSERKRDGGGGRRLEVAWVFGRQVEFGSGVGDYQPDSAFMARGVIRY